VQVPPPQQGLKNLPSGRFFGSPTGSKTPRVLRADLHAGAAQSACEAGLTVLSAKRLATVAKSRPRNKMQKAGARRFFVYLLDLPT